MNEIIISILLQFYVEANRSNYGRKICFAKGRLALICLSENFSKLNHNFIENSAKIKLKISKKFPIFPPEQTKNRENIEKKEEWSRQG